MDSFWLLLFISFFFVTNSSLLIRRCRNNQFECDNGVCINKTYWCRRGRYCNDNSENKNCGLYYPKCAKDQSHCIKDRKCIPLKWICDQHLDCNDGSDEQNCLKEGFRIEDIPGAREARIKGRLWLNKQRKTNWSWGKDTSRAIVSLRLSNDSDYHPDNITTQIIIKQMKLQLSKTLLLNDVDEIEAYEIASYVHAFLATCSNPRDFQGFDLVKLLEETLRNSKSINPMVALVICNANGTLSHQQIWKLVEIFSKNDLPYWIDSRALALMALTCMKSRNKLSNLTDRNKDQIFDLVREKRRLAKLQNKDGSFGNIYTSALLVQALITAEGNATDQISWNITKAVDFLISHQKPDGFFSDSLATYLILPILNGKTLLNLGNLSCHSEKPDTENETVWEELDSKGQEKHRVSYFIFVGKDKDIVFSLSLRVPINTTFYDIMRLAAELDNKFRFQYIDYTWGKYVYSIFGIVNHPEERNYWQLYKISQNTTFLQPPPDKVIPEEDEMFVYWYKSMND